MLWQPEHVEYRLAEAVMTLLKLPAPDHVRYAKYRSAWIEIPTDEESRRRAYGYTAADSPRVKATMAQIGRLDEVHGWTLAFLTPDLLKAARLPNDAGKILWWRAYGVPWQDIVRIRRREWGVSGKKGGRSAIPGGNSRTTLPGVHERALTLLADCLNAEKIPLVVGDAEATAQVPQDDADEVHEAQQQLDRENRELGPLSGVVRSLKRAAVDPTGTQDLRDARAKLDLEIRRRLTRC